MTTVSIHMPENLGLSGFTLFLRKTSDGTIVNTGGDTLTESPASSGRFTADVAESWAETLAAAVLDGNGLAVRDGWLAVGETVVVDAYPAVPVAFATATVSTSSTTTSVTTSACSPAGAAADQFKGRVIIFGNSTTTTALRGCAALITASSNSATPTFTLAAALPTSPVSGDTFVIA